MTERNGSPVFYDLLGQMAAMHDKKSHDYASRENPSGNYHFAGKLALLFAHSEQDAGFIGRLGEKFYRLANLESSEKTPSNESIEDTELDIAVITTLWMADRRQRRLPMQGMSSSKADASAAVLSEFFQNEPVLTQEDRRNLITYLQRCHADNEHLANMDKSGK